MSNSPIRTAHRLTLVPFFRSASKSFRSIFIPAAVGLAFSVQVFSAQGQSWTAKLDDTIRFYQATDIGAVIVGTKKSLYAVDSITGEILWRRKEALLDENDVAPVPGTDLALLSFEKGEHTRIEAIDVLSGDPVWQSEKLKGA